MSPLVAPVAEGARVGNLRVTLDGKPLGEYPVVALEAVPAAGFFGRAWDTLQTLVQVAGRRMVFLNGKFMPVEEARVPVLDRGFIFGDGVYELVPVYSRVPFRMDEHLARLERSLAAVRIRNPYSRAEWRDIILQLVAKQPFEDQGVYFQVTRGVAKRDHAFPKDAAPTVFVMSNPLVDPPQELVERGAAAVTRGRRPLAALRHQVDLADRQLPAAPGVGGRGRGRDDPVPRRQAHRGLGLERLRRQARRDPVAAEVEPDPAGHHLRRDRRARAGARACRSNSATSAKPKCAARTKSGSPRRPRKCSPS